MRPQGASRSPKGHIIMDMLDRIDYWGRMYPTEAMLLALLSVVA